MVDVKVLKKASLVCKCINLFAHCPALSNDCAEEDKKSSAASLTLTASISISTTSFAECRRTLARTRAPVEYVNHVYLMPVMAVDSRCYLFLFLNIPPLCHGDYQLTMMMMMVVVVMMVMMVVVVMMMMVVVMMVLVMMMMMMVVVMMMMVMMMMMMMLRAMLLMIA